MEVACNLRANLDNDDITHPSDNTGGDSQEHCINIEIKMTAHFIISHITLDLWLFQKLMET